MVKIAYLSLIAVAMAFLLAVLPKTIGEFKAQNEFDDKEAEFQQRMRDDVAAGRLKTRINSAGKLEYIPPSSPAQTPADFPTSTR